MVTKTSPTTPLPKTGEPDGRESPAEMPPGTAVRVAPASRSRYVGLVGRVVWQIPGGLSRYLVMPDSPAFSGLPLSFGEHELEPLQERSAETDAGHVHCYRWCNEWEYGGVEAEAAYMLERYGNFYTPPELSIRCGCGLCQDDEPPH